jgi:hypothetical protein
VLVFPVLVRPPNFVVGNVLQLLVDVSPRLVAELLLPLVHLSFPEFRPEAFSPEEPLEGVNVLEEMLMLLYIFAEHREVDAVVFFYQHEELYFDFSGLGRGFDLPKVLVYF